MNETEASAQVKEAEERKMLQKRITVTAEILAVTQHELRELRRDFKALLEHLNLSFQEVPARRALVPLKGQGHIDSGGGGDWSIP